MQRRSLVVLATTAVLGVAAASVLRRPPEAGMRRLAFAELVNHTPDRLELSGARELVLRRDGEVWRTGNGRTADAQVVAQALGRLQRLRSDAFVTDDLGRLGALGLLGEQALTVRASAGGKALATLTLGTPVEPDAGASGPVAAAHGPRLHVRVGDEVYAVDYGLRQAFDRGAEGFEERTFWREQEPQVAAFEVRRGDGTGYALTRVEDAWTLGPAPEGVRSDRAPRRFDAQQAAQQVMRLGQARAKDLVDADPGEAVTGLHAGADVVTWRLQDAAAATFGATQRRLTLGSARPEGGVWARLEGRALPFVLDSSVADGLRRPAQAFAELTLMAPFDVAQATRLQIEARPGHRLVLRREGEAWLVERGDGLPRGTVPEPNKVTARMRQFALARALGVAPGAGEAGAPKPTALRGGGRVAVTLKDGSVHALQFGGETQLRGMPVRYARGDADGQAYFVSRPLRDNLLGKLDELGRGKGPTSQAHAGATGGPQGLDSLPPEVQESIRRQLAGAQGP